ncbi:energy transducer TonB [Flavobacterium pectinovorum]|uniref:Energy transducer TonB n=1 Tax=Flavobacterium pectinovorum TaxID=29533 RepID=A0A502EQP4_9FLAO|nr:energy transducer TonB [Flavobacterium pectinovorum]TPG39424.1 energy transducer TonB [Flavobacterium pectinovorum]
MKFGLSYYYFTIIFFLSISTKSISQTPIAVSKVIYLDSMWAETSEEKYKYVRHIEEYYSEKKIYIFRDFYKSKALKMISASSDRDIIKKEGQTIYYYENGNKESSVYYSNGKKAGKEYNWYDNGNLKSEIEYFENKDKTKDSRINNYWNLQKERMVSDGNGDYEDIDEDGYEERGKVKNGVPDGTWKGKSLEEKYTFIENYENGKLISGISTDSLNIEHPYDVVYQPAAPKKGMDSFYKFIRVNLHIPQEARNKVSGKIYMTFIVDKSGKLIEPLILKGIGYGLDESAINVINFAKNWNPGIKRGIPVQVNFTLPITIAKNDL